MRLPLLLLLLTLLLYLHLHELKLLLVDGLVFFPLVAGCFSFFFGQLNPFFEVGDALRLLKVILLLLLALCRAVFFIPSLEGSVSLVQLFLLSFQLRVLLLQRLRSILRLRLQVINLVFQFSTFRLSLEEQIFLLF